MQKLTIILAFLIIVISCQKDSSIIDPNNNSKNKSSVSLYFTKPSFLDSLVVTAEAIVSATDIDTIFLMLTVTDTSVFGTIEEIPAGQNRKFEIKCYDALMNLTYSGYEFSDVQVGEIQTLEIVLYPVNTTGTVIIVGSFSPYPPSEEKIVFQADYQGTYDICIMNPDASNITQLTNSSAEDWYPQISPDRSKIVFCRRENSISRPYLMSIDGNNLQHLDILPNASVGYCGWSPDGNKLVLQANNDGDADIFIYDLTTEITTQIVFNTATDNIPNWSPDGSRIVFYSNLSGTFRSYLIDPDGSNMELLIDRSDTEERSATFSPNGSQIAMTGRNTYSQWGIFLVDFDGTNFFEVLNTQGVNEHYPVWSPDGGKIVFKRFDGGSNGYGLYMVNPDGSGLNELLDTNNYNEYNPHWR